MLGSYPDKICGDGDHILTGVGLESPLHTASVSSCESACFSHLSQYCYQFTHFSTSTGGVSCYFRWGCNAVYPDRSRKELYQIQTGKFIFSYLYKCSHINVYRQTWGLTCVSELIWAFIFTKYWCCSNKQQSANHILFWTHILFLQMHGGSFFLDMLVTMALQSNQ